MDVSYTLKYWFLTIISAYVICWSVTSLLQSSYLLAKAHLAQHLMRQAWVKTIDTGQSTPPWSWADTWPVARMTTGEQELFVLNGANMRNLAFGPAHVGQSVKIGDQGYAMILGHRDTHFAFLEHLSLGDVIDIETLDGLSKYQVTSSEVIHYEQLFLNESFAKQGVTLVTCYPFDALQRAPQWRYVVSLEKVEDNGHTI